MTKQDKRLAALDQAAQGDETAYRSLVTVRHVAECLSGGDSGSRRSRKFSDPLFMTPNGYMSAFPELDTHLFISFKTAYQAIEKYGKPEHSDLWVVRTSTLEDEIRNKRYLRWLHEIKFIDAEYVEPRRSLDERAVIYANDGMDGLKKLYSPSHAFHTKSLLLDTGLIENDDSRTK